jgi:hypothetical protein
MSSQTKPLNQLEAQELALALQPVYTFLTALQQPGANIQTAIAGVNTLELTEAAQLPVLESVGINDGAAYLQSLLQAWQAKITTVSSASGASSASGNDTAPTPDPLVSSENGGSVVA